MITQKFDLNLIHGQVRPHVNVSQYDSGSRTLEMAIYNGNERFSLAGAYTASIQGTKPDNRGFQYAATIDTVNNVITADVTQQMTAVFGDVICEVEIFDGDANNIGTGNFVLAVEKAALSDDTVVSDTDIPLIQQAAAIAPLIPAMVQDISDLKQDVDDLEDVVLSDEIITTKNFAALIEVDDAIPVNAVDVKAKIEPVQDLHGYTKPWVGGAGKNLLPTTLENLKAVNTTGVSWSGNEATVANVKYTVLTDADNNVIGINVNGTASGESNFITIPRADGWRPTQNTFIISGCPSGATSSWCMKCNRTRSGSGAYIGEVLENGREVTFDSNDEALGVWISVQSGTQVTNKIFYPQVEAGSAKTAFEPYTNICPITGHSEAKITRAGKNLLQGLESGAIDQATGQNTSGSATRSINHISVVPSKSYTISGLLIEGGSIRVFKYDDSKSYLGNEVVSFSNYKITLTIQSGVHYIRFQGGTTTFMPSTNVQVELGTDATTYEPFIACDEYIIDLNGTRYDGTLDVDAGTLTAIDNGFFVLNGTEGITWSITANANFQTVYTNLNGRVSGIKTTGGKQQSIIFNCFKRVTYGEVGGAFIDNGWLNMLFPVGTFVDSAAFNTWLTNNNIQFTYELATTQSATLAPQQVQLLQNYNVLFADTGDVSLQYRTMSVENIAASLGDVQEEANNTQNALADYAEKSDLASISISGTTNNTGATIAAGTYFYLNGALVKAKTSISNGATLTSGTNYESVTAGGLNELNKATKSTSVSFSNATGNGYAYKYGHIGVISLDITPSDSTDTTVTLPSGFTLDQNFYQKHTVNSNTIYVYGYDGNSNFKIAHSNTDEILLTLPIALK